ncbi:hypothetical protein [Leuconostoc pseudomesenteroides]|uniref:hypothetical protein n=1 Tax=Leuconostoc pseudomesenteroides TaxID=33968 RepID=UPI004036F253
MLFELSESNQLNQMISGKPGKGRGYYLKRRVVVIYAIRHPLRAIKLVVNFFKA